ncbi:Asp23/Gls24 family envelope stress response protein [Bacillus solimangrovi]|uniref:Alkaline-shock protein n=1 Tax=Bacillus solimangrovi TaxID=1305675 RepID=A0A1E5LK61_9BACI|nr:Asp23/Gls24 family envelope stress response protein [Bacillus solimangrovi]OEH94489.1 hypothetical protein BFG57_07390 [Bacillus solimangrovi]
MSENNILEMTNASSNFGKVEIAPEVIEIIAGIAASEVDGVSQLQGNFASGVVERLGKKQHGKGIKVELTEDGIVVDVHVFMNFGISIPDIAKQIQENIRETLFTMTGLDISEINIHVVGVNFESTTEPEVE